MSDELFTAEEAAAEVGVDVGTIHTWRSRGFLSPVPGKKRGRFHLYRLADVFTCEAERKRKHRRKVGMMLWPIFILVGSAAAEEFSGMGSALTSLL